MKNQYKKFAPKLAELGYDTTPVSGKRPIIEGWSGRPDAAKDYDRYADNGIGVVLGGKHNLIAVDVDVTNPFAANAIEKLIQDRLGDAPKRVGKAPKFLMVFRTDEPMKKIKTAVFDIEASEDDGCVEVLAEGQQFVASGIHPDTGQKYQWPNDNLTDYPVTEIPLVNKNDVVTFIEAANTLLHDYGVPKQRQRNTGLNVAPAANPLHLKEQSAPLEEIDLAVAHIPNEDLHYDDWVQMAHAIKGACGEPGFDLFCRWSARSSKNDPAKNERLWQSIVSVNSIGAGSIFHHASEYGFDISAHRAAKSADIKPASNKISEPKFDEETGEIIEFTGIAPGRLSDFNPRSIKPRRWIMKDRYIRGKVTLTIAPPGVGKSTLTMQEALSVAAGIDFAGRETMVKGKAWIYNNEDDTEELLRRIVAACKSLGIEFDDIKDRVFINSGEVTPLVVAREQDHETVITEHVEQCMDVIKRENIDLFVVDPFVETHTVNENANDAMNRVARAYRQIAQDCDCAVSLVHHSRKAQTGDSDAHIGNADTSRGAGSVVGVSRVAQTLYPMTKNDAKKYGIKDNERNLFIRLDDAKANLSLVSGNAIWFRRSAQFVPHGSLGLSGDYVGVLMHIELDAVEAAAGGVTPAQAAYDMIKLHGEASINVIAQRLEDEGKLGLKKRKIVDVLKAIVYPYAIRDGSQFNHLDIKKGVGTAQIMHISWGTE